ncbi:cytochrome P450 [Trametes coccinea BRFM310]|uniref:Cytochrome P450 n=1 Tax=Trametes coccinea (strain BRFM310) TaxID=1353009 RepID=A0A1Y2IFQ0_TRAC3|nr:cytochrome P450 [Trametes coccinea BRFM310]
MSRPLREMSTSLSLPFQDALAVVSTILVYALWRLYKRWSFVYRSPLRNLPGPPSPSWLYGNMKEVFTTDGHAVPDKWFAQYGRTYVDHGFGMTPQLWTLDLRAIHHILTHSMDYGVPEDNVKTVGELLGKGLLLVHGEQHRQQRRIMNPAFGPGQIRDLTPVFLQKANELGCVWSRAVENGPARLDVSGDFSKMTLDIIGLAGFGYDFQALNAEGKSNEFNVAFKEFSSNVARIPRHMRYLWPYLKPFPIESIRRVQRVAATIRRISAQLLQERKAAILREKEVKHTDGVQSTDLHGRDLLTLLIKANMAKDVPENQRLSDEDVVGQVPTFLMAGHETTSIALSWALFALSKNPTVQRKLREELLAVPSNTPTMEELSALPYLDMVVRETLRLHAPVAMRMREAKRDDVIPVSEPFTDRHGKVQNEIRIAKGNLVMLPILALHRSKEIWGEDALEFKPERWEQPPGVSADIPGIWGHLLSFLGGPRACIGYRFSLTETKAALFTLLRAFEFELAVPPEQITTRTAPLQRPFLRGEERPQLPLIVKAYKGL